MTSQTGSVIPQPPVVLSPSITNSNPSLPMVLSFDDSVNLEVLDRNEYLDSQKIKFFLESMYESVRNSALEVIKEFTIDILHQHGIMDRITGELAAFDNQFNQGNYYQNIPYYEKRKVLLKEKTDTLSQINYLIKELEDSLRDNFFMTDISKVGNVKYKNGKCYDINVVKQFFVDSYYDCWNGQTPFTEPKDFMQYIDDKFRTPKGINDDMVRDALYAYNQGNLYSNFDFTYTNDFLQDYNVLYNTEITIFNALQTRRENYTLN